MPAATEEIAPSANGVVKKTKGRKKRKTASKRKVIKKQSVVVSAKSRKNSYCEICKQGPFTKLGVAIHAGKPKNAKSHASMFGETVMARRKTRVALSTSRGIEEIRDKWLKSLMTSANSRQGKLIMEFVVDLELALRR